MSQTQKISHDEIVAACIMGDESIFCQVNLSERRADKLLDATARINREAREWNWGAVENLLDTAYAAIGGKNPGTGYEYHCGDHPVQAALRRMEF